MEKKGRERRRVVLVPFPFQGHITPMLDLGTALYSRGFSVTIAHPKFNSPNPSNHPPDFTFLPLSDGLTERDMHFGLVKILNANCEAQLKESLTPVRDQIACIIYDAVMYVGEAAANYLNLPSIILRGIGAHASVAYGAMHQLHAAGCFPLQESKLQELVPQLHPLRFKDLPCHTNDNFEPYLQIIAEYCKIRTSSAIIWNTADCLERAALAELQQRYQIPFFLVGPLFKTASAPSSSLLEEDMESIEWLDKQSANSVLYVSLGSVASVDEKELAEMAWGLANSGQPFLWVIRPGSVPGSQWIELLPEGFKGVIEGRGLIVKWAPQKVVLAHGAVGGFWSHCGWNSTLESIGGGVPMICSPRSGDQKVNARYISHVWMVGLELENGLERGHIEREIKRLMKDEEGEVIRRRATEFKENLEMCVKKGGSSYNSLIDLENYILSL